MGQRGVLLSLLALACASHAAASTTITGGIVANQTWTAAGSPYLVQGDITIPAGGQLTVEPGTVIQMAATDAQAGGRDTSRIEMTVKGTLSISGSGAKPVILESQTGTAANWYGLVIQDSTSSASIHYAVI